jgi:hypothetical protein
MVKWNCCHNWDIREWENQLTVFGLGVGSRLGGEKITYEKNAPSHCLVYAGISGYRSGGPNEKREHPRGDEAAEP